MWRVIDEARPVYLDVDLSKDFSLNGSRQCSKNEIPVFSVATSAFVGRRVKVSADERRPISIRKLRRRGFKILHWNGR